MRLQIKKLEGPDEIRLNVNPNRSHTPTVAANNAANRFSCYFNRNINNDDTFPINVHIYIFNTDGTRQGDPIELTVNRNNINNNNNFCFTLAVDSPLMLSGSHIYIQALLRNRVAATTYIYVSTTNKSHETFKKVLIYAQKNINHVYWSNNEVIDTNRLNEQENPRTGSIGQNEDAFLHIKTIGMYNDMVQVILTAGEDITLKSIQIRLLQNHKVVAFNMENIIAQYRRMRDIPTGPVNIQLRVTVMYLNQNRDNFSFATIADLIVPPLSTENTLNVVLENQTPPAKKTSTGTVYVNVNLDEPQPVTPTEYTDFMLGYILHVHGVATEISPGAGGKWSISAVARYPMDFYELRLSDLVSCGIVTKDDARTMTLDRNGTTLKNEQAMLTSFDKRQTVNQVIFLNRLKTGNEIDNEKARRVLDYLRRTPEEGGRGVSRSRLVCRDGWQTQSSGANRSPTGRYNQSGESPPGAYFINFLPLGPGRKSPSYNLFLSKRGTAGDSLLSSDPYRDGVAIHRGDSYFAYGCITVYTSYTNKTEQLNVTNTLFQVNTETPSNAGTFDKRRLNIIILDERNAQQTVGYKNRWYDPVAPGKFLSSITAPSTALAESTITCSVSINKSSLAANDAIAEVEKEGIRWEYRIGTGAYQQLSEFDGQTQITLEIDKDWGGKQLEIKAKSFNNFRHNNNGDNEADIATWGDYKTKKITINKPVQTQQK